MHIVQIETWSIELPLARPIVVARQRVAQRRYLMLRITDELGVCGLAAGLLRGAAPAAELHAAAHALLGIPLDEPAELWTRAPDVLGDTTRTRELTRVLSLLDIALWDCTARRLGIPLHKATGTSGESIPVLLYGGFAEDLRDELTAYAADGAWGVKLARQPGEIAEEVARLRTAREALGTGTQLVLDAGWSWRTSAEAVPYARAFEPVRLAWLEDPFALHEVAPLAELHAATDVPLGAGDEWSDPYAYERLIASRSVAVVRIDATYAGGVTGFLRTARLARAQNLRVSAHMHDYLHVQLLGAASGSIVERASATSGIDPLHEVLATTATVRAGHMIQPDGPGLGVAVDWERLRSYAVEHAIIRV